MEEEPTLPFPAPVDATFDVKCPYCGVSSQWNRLVCRSWRPSCRHVALVFHDRGGQEWRSLRYEFLESELFDVAEQRVDGAPEHVRKFICYHEDMGAGFYVLFVKEPDEFRAWLYELQRPNRS